MSNINRVFLFGDSWIEGQGMDDEPQLDGESLSQWRKDNSWNLHLGNHFNVIENYARQGCSNYTQFHSFGNIVDELTDTDLVLFGFTSKLRDTRESMRYVWNHNIFPNTHPMNGFLAWEQIDMKNELFPHDPNEANLNKSEKQFFDTFKYDFISDIFDEIVYENIAQTNLLFLDLYLESKNVKRLYFDLFEPYVSPKYVKNSSWIPENYLTYGKQTLFEMLTDYEKNNFTKSDDKTIWECRHKFPKGDSIWHPNEIGYEVLSNWLVGKIKEFYN